MKREHHENGNHGNRNHASSLATGIEQLLRSLHGVAGARAILDQAGRLTVVYVVPSDGPSARGLTRNVQSALMATLRLQLDARAILVVPELPCTVPTAEPAATPARPPARRLVGIGRLGLHAASGYRPPPRVELLELRRHGETLLCRVVIEVGGRRRTGAAESGEDGEGSVTLAARATLDALRYLEPGEWLFEGAADAIIGGQRHVVVSICRHEDAPSLSGAAPVLDTIERAVAVAVMNAAGLSSALAPDNNHRLLPQHAQN